MELKYLFALGLITAALFLIMAQYRKQRNVLRAENGGLRGKIRTLLKGMDVLKRSKTIYHLMDTTISQSNLDWSDTMWIEAMNVTFEGNSVNIKSGHDSAIALYETNRAEFTGNIFKSEDITNTTTLSRSALMLGTVHPWQDLAGNLRRALRHFLFAEQQRHQDDWWYRYFF